MIFVDCFFKRNEFMSYEMGLARLWAANVIDIDVKSKYFAIETAYCVKTYA